MQMYEPEEIAVYIHWPFCKSKCPYCDFYKEIDRHEAQEIIIDEYISALDRYHDLTSDRTVKSIFFGGGTPSLIEPRNVSRIIDFISGKWQVLSQAEISLEANPNSCCHTMFTDLKNAGINRLSLGIQALNDADLKFLGRTHNLAQARSYLHEVVDVFNNHSADLIYARPQQDLMTWQQELEEITNYGLKHISLYQLTIEEGTVFYRKGIQPLDDASTLQLYDYTCAFLADKGYHHYEVSNFAQKGFASIHNLTYWQGGDYIGIGKSAHGRLFLNGEHFATEYPFIHQKLSPQERAEELIITGLRLVRGISKKTFKEICGIALSDFINQTNLKDLCSLQLMAENEESIYVTAKGFPVLNEIIRQLCV